MAQSVQVVLLAYDGERPVGCAGLRRYGSDTAEVKRVYVEPDLRGQGIGRALLIQLEETARELGFSRLLLETGEPLRAATALYRSRGFVICPNYLPYDALPDSICMTKNLRQ